MRRSDFKLLSTLHTNSRLLCGPYSLSPQQHDLHLQTLTSPRCFALEDGCATAQHPAPLAELCMSVNLRGCCTRHFHIFIRSLRASRLTLSAHSRFLPVLPPHLTWPSMHNRPASSDYRSRIITSRSTRKRSASCSAMYVNQQHLSLHLNASLRQISLPLLLVCTLHCACTPASCDARAAWFPSRRRRSASADCRSRDASRSISKRAASVSTVLHALEHSLNSSSIHLHVLN